MIKEDKEEKERIKNLKSFTNKAVHGWVKCSSSYLELLQRSCGRYGLTEQVEEIENLIKKLKS